jgi:hypothetical protein
LADPSVVVGVEILVGLVDDDLRGLRVVVQVRKEEPLELGLGQTVVVILRSMLQKWSTNDQRP